MSKKWEIIGTDKDKAELIQAFENMQSIINKQQAEIERLKNPWISIDNALPEKGGKYLVLLNNHQRHIAVWVSVYWAIGIDTISSVTHWQPLPKPPEAES